LLKQLFSLLPAYIDLEYDTSPDFVKRMALEYPQVKILFSYHNFESTPTDLEALFARMQSSHVYAYKIATMAYSSLDALRLMEFVKTQTQRGIKMTGLCMGDKGQLTRILGPLYGNLFD